VADPSGLTGFWKKSSHSTTGDCVEVRRERGVIQVRDSKCPRGPVLEFTDSEWLAFVAGVTAGEFSLPE
jgi:hypothetical protein